MNLPYFLLDGHSQYFNEAWDVHYEPPSPDVERKRHRVKQALLLKFGEGVSRHIAEYQTVDDLHELPPLYASALAGELLLSPQHIPCLERFMPEGWRQMPIFRIGKDDCFDDCIFDAFQDCTVSASLFPYLHKDGPGVGRIWAVCQNKNQSRLPGTNLSCLENSSFIRREAANRNVRLYVDVGGECVGESWQLSAWLAMSAVSDCGSDGKTRVRLAREWIATGKVSPDGVVNPVKIGDKPNVGLGRKWLISEADKDSFQKQDDGKERKCITVGNVHTAYSHVAGSDIRQDAPRRFKLKSGEFHCILDLLKIKREEIPALLEMKRSIIRRVCRTTNVVVWLEIDDTHGPREERGVMIEGIRSWCKDQRFGFGELPCGSMLDIRKKLREHANTLASGQIPREVWFDTTDSDWCAEKAVDSLVRENDSFRIVHLSEDGRWMSFRYEAGHPYVGDFLALQ